MGRGAAITGALLMFASSASAGGYTFAAPGAVPMGRGGAAIARVEPALAGWMNPALLADVGLPEIEVGTNIAIFKPCVQRSGVYGDNVPNTDTNNDRLTVFGRFGEYRDEPFPRSCADGSPGVIPYLMTSLRLHDKVGLGFGIFPPLGTARLNWGDSVRNASGELRPQPVRYNFVDQQGRLIRGVVSLGYRPSRYVSIGAGFVWGATLIETTIHQVFFGGEEPSQDLESNIRASDRFIPGVLGSIHLNPHPNLDVTLFFHWLDKSRANGRLRLTSGIYGTSEPSSGVPETIRAQGVTVNTPQPREIRMAIRYADRRGNARTDRRDPLHDERWDVEFMMGYERTGHIDAFVARVPDGNTIDIVSRDADGVIRRIEDQTVRTETVVPKGFRDQLTLGLGGDVAVVPDRFALRAGLSFETKGLDPNLAQTDFQPTRRLGLHAGLTLRLGPIDISMAYMHVFQESVTAAPGELVQEVTIGSGRIVNGGRYTMRFDALSIAITGRR